MDHKQEVLGTRILSIHVSADDLEWSWLAVSGASENSRNTAAIFACLPTTRWNIKMPRRTKAINGHASMNFCKSACNNMQLKDVAKIQ